MAHPATVKGRPTSLDGMWKTRDGGLRTGVALGPQIKPQSRADQQSREVLVLPKNRAGRTQDGERGMTGAKVGIPQTRIPHISGI